MPLKQYPNLQGGAPITLERLWDADEVKALVKYVTDPAKDAVKFEV